MAHPRKVARSWAVGIALTTAAQFRSALPIAAGASDSIFTRAAGIPSHGVGGGWNDIDDTRMHGRDERNKIDNFYQTVEFTYRLMKKLSSVR